MTEHIWRSKHTRPQDDTDLVEVILNNSKGAVEDEARNIPWESIESWRYLSKKEIREVSTATESKKKVYVCYTDIGYNGCSSPLAAFSSVELAQIFQKGFNLGTITTDRGMIKEMVIDEGITK